MAKFLVGNKVENAGSYRIKFYNSKTKEFIHEVEYSGESDKSIKYNLTKLVEDTTDKFKKDVNYFLTISAIPEDDSKYIESESSEEINFIIKDVAVDPGEGGGETDTPVNPDTPDNPESGGETEEDNIFPPTGYTEIQPNIKEGYRITPNGVETESSQMNLYYFQLPSNYSTSADYAGYLTMTIPTEAKKNADSLIFMKNTEDTGNDIVEYFKDLDESQEFFTQQYYSISPENQIEVMYVSIQVAIPKGQEVRCAYIEENQNPE